MKALAPQYAADADPKRKQLAQDLAKLAEEFFDIPHDI